MRWCTFLQLNWARLVAGHHIHVPLSASPASFGFERTALAEPAGQFQDWVMSLSDGSRLHLWLMGDGRWILHRDRIDPARGPVEATTHWLTESKSGKFAAMLLGMVAIGYGVALSRA